MAAYRPLAFAACIGIAVAMPAAAQVKTAPAATPAVAPTPTPASAPAKPAPAPRDKVVSLPTAVDGDVSYRFDATTGLPVSSSDERAMVTAAALSFLPKKKGEPLQWNMYYSLQFAKGVVPKFILVYDEGVKPLKLEVGDAAPTADKGQWSASSKPATVDKATWDSMISPKTWYLQRKFMIEYSDGTERTLHQLSVVTQQMRLELLQKVTGMNLLQPAATPATPAAPAAPATKPKG